MLVQEQIEALQKLSPRQLGQYSKPYFVKNYLGLNIPEHQKVWYDYCEKKRHVQLSPRAHGKTTVFLHAFPVWAICYIPNVRILIVSKSSTQAMKSMDVIRRELKTNEKIKRDFGQLLLKPKNESGAIWCKRDKEGQKFKDPTVEAVGAEGAITGGHFDIIICDDIIDDENTKTDNRMAQVKNWVFGTIGQLCEPESQWIVVGTRKHYADIYGELIENPIWHKAVERAIIKYPSSYEYVFKQTEDGQKVLSDVKIEGDYEVLWPEEWDIKSLLLDRYQTGSILFDREKQNDPAGMKGQFLLLDWLHYWDELPPEDELTFYVGIDLAISEKEQADETGFALVAYHGKSQRIFLVDIVHGRWDFPTQQKKLVDYYNMWANHGMRPAHIFVEDNVYQAAFVQQISK